jgi:hypothetical protein
MIGLKAGNILKNLILSMLHWLYTYKIPGIVYEYLRTLSPRNGFGTLTVPGTTKLTGPIYHIYVGPVFGRGIEPPAASGPVPCYFKSDGQVWFNIFRANFGLNGFVRGS